MQYWVNGKICVDDKIKMANILLKTNLPAFHYSILEASVQASKMSYFFNKLQNFRDIKLIYLFMQLKFLNLPKYVSNSYEKRKQ